MSNYGPEERALFESEATALYEDIVAHGGIKKDDPRIAAKSGSARAAFDMLLDLDLVNLDAPTATYVAVDPSTIQSRIVAPLGLRGAELLTESSEWAKAFGTLSHAWRRSPESARGPFTEIHGPDAIQSYIAGVVADCEEELLTAQPQTGRDAAIMAAAAQRDGAALERGIKMRTLYQHSARRSAVTHKYVAAVTARGAEVRTLDEFFNRIIVVDRRIAIDPRPGRARGRAVDPRAVTGGVPRRHLRAHLGAGPAVHQPRDLDDARHRRRAAGDDDPDADRGPRRPGQRQAAGRQPAHVRRLRRRPEGGVRGGDPVPAGLRDGPAGRVRQRAPDGGATRAARNVPDCPNACPK